MLASSDTTQQIGSSFPRVIQALSPSTTAADQRFACFIKNKTVLNAVHSGAVMLVIIGSSPSFSTLVTLRQAICLQVICTNSNTTYKIIIIALNLSHKEEPHNLEVDRIKQENLMRARGSEKLKKEERAKV
jgi:hypothetical protein